jgi:hypothetical protein
MKKYILLSVVSVVLFYSCGQKQDEKKVETPIPSNCKFSQNGKDSLGKKLRVVEAEKFMALQFPDSATQALYKGEDFVKGYLSCVTEDTVLAINVDVTIHTEDAYQYYGTIKKGNNITFILKSGKTVEVPFGSTFSGNTNISKESTEYSSFAHLSRDAAKQLKSEDLQRVIISWSKKDEEYPAVNPKIFINQLPCVE